VSALKQANEIIFSELQNRIINLELEPGTVINEKALMEEFDVSRTPVREALIKLSQIGLIETRPRVGTFVTQIDIKSVKNAYEVKKNLEGLAAELAAKRATDEEIKELFEIIERFKGYDIVKDYKLCIQDDQRFHYLIRQAARNEILIEVLDMLNTKTARFLQSIHYVISDYDWFSNSLVDIANAIYARDAEEARKHTEIHTKEFLDQMSRHFFG
jgi:DNA-binding GntR family transcriptional regulator